MEKTNKVEVFILDPATGKLVSIEAWKNQPDPTVAESVVIRNEFGQHFELAKKKLVPKDGDEEKDEMKFADALEAAEKLGGKTGTRKQWIDVYEAIYTAGLNKALELIGGDIIEREWYWTEEKDSDQSNADNAWIFNGNYGNLYYAYRFYTFAARVFRAFNIDLNPSNLPDAGEPETETTKDKCGRIGGIPAADLRSAAEKISAAAVNLEDRILLGERADGETLALVEMISPVVKNINRLAKRRMLQIIQKTLDGERNKASCNACVDPMDR